MADETEGLRRARQAAIEGGGVEVEGEVWTTDDLQRDFEVLGFLAPYVSVVRKVDGVQGSLEFRHSPRMYFHWRAA